MKAILVFDINNLTYEAIEQYFTGVITMHLGDDRVYDIWDVGLKPMPQKKVEDFTEYWYKRGFTD